MDKNEIVIFETEDNQVKLEVNVEGETVWLSTNQMAVLFERDEKTIRKHINNAFSEMEVDKINNTQKMRVEGVKQLVTFYTRCYHLRWLSSKIQTWCRISSLGKFGIKAVHIERLCRE